MANDEISVRDRVGERSSRFSEVFARAPVPMLIADVDGVVLEANDAFARMLGLRSASEVIGRAGMLLFERRQLTRLSRAEGDRTFRARWESHRGGVRRVLEVTAWAIDPPGDEPPQIAVSFTDVTSDAEDRHRAPRASSQIDGDRAPALLVEAQVEPPCAPRAGRFDAAQAALLAELASDLEERLELLRARAAHRNVLRAVEECQARLGAELAVAERQATVRGLQEVLTRMASLVGELDPEPSSRHRELVEGLEASIERTVRLARAMRRGEREDVVSDLGAIVDAQRELLDSAMGARIEVLVDLAPDALPVPMDDALVEEVLWDLALNARDAMAEGGTLTIETGRAPSSSHAFLAVSDTGTGVPDDLRVTASEPSGRGLESIRQMVERHGGRLEVDGELGCGSRCTVWLPTSTERLSVGETILLIHDEPTTRLALARLLRALGYRVADVESVDEARRTARSLGAALDLVITDFELAGFDLARAALFPLQEQPFDAAQWSRSIRACLDGTRWKITRRASSRASSRRRRSRCSGRRSAG